MTELQEARLLGRAIRGRWDIPDAKKIDVMESLMDLATNGAEESTRVAACRAIIVAEAQNQKDEHAEVDDFRRKLIELATQLDARCATAREVGPREIADSPGADS